jgi:hypothetical protein
MFFSLIALMPGHPWVLAGRITGIGGYIIVAFHLSLYLKTAADQRTPFDKTQMYGAGILFFTFSLLLWVPDLRVKGLRPDLDVVLGHGGVLVVSQRQTWEAPPFESVGDPLAPPQVRGEALCVSASALT